MFGLFGGIFGLFGEYLRAFGGQGLRVLSCSSPVDGGFSVDGNSSRAVLSTWLSCARLLKPR